MRVGLLGGSFDPPHRGHLALAVVARRQLRLDRVYLVLSPRSPFKGRSGAPGAGRWRMLKAAVRGVPGVHAAPWEMRRRGPSYTITTLRSYSRRRPSDTVFLVVGSDVLAGISKWKDAAEIPRYARLAVGRRPGARSRVPAMFSGAAVWLRGRFPDVSSSMIRGAARTALPGDVLSPAVLRLIQKEGWYRFFKGHLSVEGRSGG